MFISDNINKTIQQYNLSAAWDISTASFSTSIPAQDGTPGTSQLVTDLCFSADGTNLYETGKVDGGIYCSTLPTPWSLSGAYLLNFFDVSSQTTDPQDVVFNEDGTKMFISAMDYAVQYDLSTAWDITSASFALADSAHVDAGSIRGFVFSANGRFLYALDTIVDEIRQYRV